MSYELWQTSGLNSNRDWRYCWLFQWPSQYWGPVVSFRENKHWKYWGLNCSSTSLRLVNICMQQHQLSQSEQYFWQVLPSRSWACCWPAYYDLLHWSPLYNISGQFYETFPNYIVKFIICISFNLSMFFLLQEKVALLMRKEKHKKDMNRAS